MNIDNNRIELGGFRLQYFEVQNWGTFHEKFWRIEPNGLNSLLTGDIGSGKSTLVDGLTCLIVPHHKIVFNKAAGAENKERSIRSYVRGEYKKEKNESTNVVKDIPLRPNNDTYSVLVANFHNAGLKEDVCLAQMFWMKDEKPEKLLIISTSPLRIKEHFSGFEDVQELKKKLRKINSVQLFDDNFSKYSDHSRRLFGMNSDKAIDLFNKTVSMKSVPSLTEFVRDHMLEKSDIKAQIEILRKRFDDLNNAHQAVVTAREQLDILRPLVDHTAAFNELSNSIRQIDVILRVMPAWFADKHIELLTKDIETCEVQLVRVTDQLNNLNSSIDKMRDKEGQLRQDIFNNGGKRLEEIQKEIEQHEVLKDGKYTLSEKYTSLASVIGLKKADDEKQFYKNVQTIQDLKAKNNLTQNQIIADRDECKLIERSIKTQINFENSELLSLRSRKSQIPEVMVNIRQQIAEDLDIKESDIPFVGELLKVHEEETEWEGAIERLLHNFGLSMIVPIDLYNRISHYVNHTTLQSRDGKRQRLVYYRADNSLQKRNVPVKDDSVIQKLLIKEETPYAKWLEQELSHRFNYACAKIEDFQRIPDAITKEGQIKSGWQRHEKDDRQNINDRRSFVLGWSNASKIDALEKSIEKLRHDLDDKEQEIKKLELEASNCKTIDEKIRDLSQIIRYSEIDWKSENLIIQTLKDEKANLESSSNILQSLQEQLSLVKTQIGKAEEEKKEKMKVEAELSVNITNAKEKISDCDKTIGETVKEVSDDYEDRINGYMSDRRLTVKNIETEQIRLYQTLAGEKGERTTLVNKQNGLRDKIITRMKDLKTHSQSETGELPSNMDALPEYLKMYERIANDDLPRHEARFKDELNKNTIQSIAIFHSKLESYQNDILDKVHEINRDSGPC